MIGKKATFLAAVFVGSLAAASAADITNPQTDASQLTTGTLANARLPAAISVTSLTASGLVQAGSTLGISTDVLLARDAANTLAQRNGVNAQLFNLYNTYTDASNNEYLFFGWSGNHLYIAPTKTGTGTYRDIRFQTSGTDQWNITTGGDLATIALGKSILTSGQIYLGTANPTSASFNSSLATTALYGNTTFNLCWSSTAGQGNLAACDTNLSRDAGGIVDFGSGAQGSKAGSWNATNGVLLGTLGVTGTSTLGVVNTSGAVTQTLSQSTNTRFTSSNVNAGTAATAGYLATNDGGTGYVQMVATGTGYTTAAPYTQDGGTIESGAALSGGLSISAGAGTLKLYAASTVADTISTTSHTIPLAIIHTGITTDATHTDAAVCEDTTTHQYYFGSGTLGICLGTSSKRYKESIKPMGDGLSQITALKPINFRYKKGRGDDGAREQYGFLAEDVIDVLPKLVALDKDKKPNSVDLLAMVPVLVKAVQELQAEVDTLKAQNEALKSTKH